MIKFAGQGILLDIEGTTSSLRFVHEVLFPYARTHLAVFLRYRWDHPQMPRLREELARFHGAETFESWTGGKGMPPEHRLKQMREGLLKLMDQDSKMGPLKEIQGLIWKEGYRKGLLKSHVYPDVIEALMLWKQCKIDVRIYSSGSKEAQKLFFQHVVDESSEEINLARYLSGYYDTAVGPKQDATSYLKIAAAFELPPANILFLSDVSAELDAARQVGLQTALVQRPDADKLSEPSNVVSTLEAFSAAPPNHPVITTFREVILERHGQETAPQPGI